MVFFKNKTKNKSMGFEKSQGMSEKEQQTLSETATQLQNKLESSSQPEKVRVLNELGGIFFQLNDIDNAIKYYEMSIAANRSLGKAHADLLKLYNLKRKQAAELKDEATIQVYLDKMDDLMKLTKDEIRGLQH